MEYSRQTVSPESLGIPSAKIIDLINYLRNVKYNIHSFMIVKDGKVAVEAYYEPFCKEDKKRLYSCSKTVCALAVGKLVADGFVKVSDTLISYFPEVEYCDPVMKTVTIAAASFRSDHRAIPEVCSDKSQSLSVSDELAVLDAYESPLSGSLGRTAGNTGCCNSYRK